MIVLNSKIKYKYKADIKEINKSLTQTMKMKYGHQKMVNYGNYRVILMILY